MNLQLTGDKMLPQEKEFLNKIRKSYLSYLGALVNDEQYDNPHPLVFAMRLAIGSILRPDVIELISEPFGEQLEKQ